MFNVTSAENIAFHVAVYVCLLNVSAPIQVYWFVRLPWEWYAMHGFVERVLPANIFISLYACIFGNRHSSVYIHTPHTELGLDSNQFWCLSSWWLLLLMIHRNSFFFFHFEWFIRTHFFFHFVWKVYAKSFWMKWNLICRFVVKICSFPFPFNIQ